MSVFELSNLYLYLITGHHQVKGLTMTMTAQLRKLDVAKFTAVDSHNDI